MDLQACMYVCLRPPSMYVCMYVCMYAKHVCMYVEYIHTYIHAQHTYIHTYMLRHTYVCIVCMSEVSKHVCMSPSMYVCLRP